jgi:hypothetical protein
VVPFSKSGAVQEGVSKLGGEVYGMGAENAQGDITERCRDITGDDFDITAGDADVTPQSFHKSQNNSLLAHIKQQTMGDGPPPSPGGATVHTPAGVRVDNAQLMTAAQPRSCRLSPLHSSSSSSHSSNN